MTREEWAECLPLIQAFVEGKIIQVADKGCSNWTDKLEPCFDSFENIDYRIKPEPKVIWVNEYANDETNSFPTKEEAMQTINKFAKTIRMAVKYIESVDD